MGFRHVFILGFLFLWKCWGENCTTLRFFSTFLEETYVMMPWETIFLLGITLGNYCMTILLEIGLTLKDLMLVFWISPKIMIFSSSIFNELVSSQGKLEMFLGEFVICKTFISIECDFVCSHNIKHKTSWTMLPRMSYIFTKHGMHGVLPLDYKKTWTNALPSWSYVG